MKGVDFETARETRAWQIFNHCGVGWKIDRAKLRLLDSKNRVLKNFHVRLTSFILDIKNKGVLQPAVYISDNDGYIYLENIFAQSIHIEFLVNEKYLMQKHFLHLGEDSIKIQRPYARK